MEGFVQFKAIRSQEQLNDVIVIAKGDQHDVVCPTHQLLKDGKGVGYASIGGLPMVILHVHSTEVATRETFHIINTYENIAAGNGASRIMVPVASSQPAHGLMEKMGYKKLANVDLFIKEL